MEGTDVNTADEVYSTVVGLIFSGNIDSFPVTCNDISDESKKDNSKSGNEMYN